MMNEQQLEYVRINLRAALLDSSGGTKGQLEAFAEHQPADKQRNPRKPVHIVALMMAGEVLGTLKLKTQLYMCWKLAADAGHYRR